jgi:hypothetical protein
MPYDWRVFAGLVLGIGGLILGIEVRLGWNRRWRDAYFGDTYPASIRNSFMALIPTSLAFVFIAAGVLLQPRAAGETLKSAEPMLLSAVFLILAGVSLGIAGWTMLRPPAWSKPRWLLEEEQARRDGRPVAPIKAESISPRAYRVAWAVWLAALVAWHIFDHPPGVLAGLGIGGGILVGARPRAAVVPSYDRDRHPRS